MFKKRSEAAHAAVFDFLFTASDIPPTVLKALAKLLLLTPANEILSAMHQRHPEAVGAAIEELVSEGKGSREELENAVMNLAIVSLYICFEGEY